MVADGGFLIALRACDDVNVVPYLFSAWLITN